MQRLHASIAWEEEVSTETVSLRVVYFFVFFLYSPLYGTMSPGRRGHIYSAVLLPLFNQFCSVVVDFWDESKFETGHRISLREFICPSSCNPSKTP